MTRRKPHKNIIIIFTLLALSLSLVGCGGSARTVASGWAGITTDDDTAYVAFNTQVVAIDLANGTVRWRYPNEPDAKISFYAPPALTDDGGVIVGGYDNILYRINADNGQGTPFFEGANGRYIGGVLVTPNYIYAPSADHNLYALDMNGNQVWNFKTGEPIWASPAADPDCSCIYLSSMDHKVYALDAATGNLGWTTDDLGGSIVSTPLVSDDLVLYVGTFANELIALDASTGAELWRFGTANWVWGSPALDGDNLYFGDLSGTFYAVDRYDGATQWQIQPGGAIVGTPLITDNGIYFTTEDGSLIAVTPEGTIRFNQPFETSLHAGPVTAGDTILVTTSDPEKLLIALDQNGVQKWSFSEGN